MKKIIFLLFILFSLGAYSQNLQNYKNVNVSTLNNAQIQQIIQQMESRGLTIDQAAALAQAQGASPQQISDLKRRIQDYKNGKNQSVINVDAAVNQSSTISREAFSEKVIINATPKNKKIFGFHLFNNENLTFEPSVNIPAPLNYVIGIGDELMINIWGASQQTYQLMVDKNGAISIPDLGPIFVNGINFKKAKALIKKRLIEIYSDLGNEEPKTWAEVSMGTLRGIKVNIIGEVNAPGTYNLPSTASAFNALYLSGGPNENGSFRNIYLKRAGESTQTIDVYDFLINGNTDCDLQLRDQDIIFIPTYEKRVEVSGAFKHPGFFELKAGEKLDDLIRYCGNFTEDAYQYRLNIDRFTDKEKEILNVEKSEFNQFELRNGDIVNAGKVIDRYQNKVSISGAVYRPGQYELTKGLTLAELIQKAEGVKEEVFSNRGVIIREKPDKSTLMIAFDVKDIIKGNHDIPLIREDSVAIRNIFEMREEYTVNLIGEVQKAGQYPYHEKMTLKDLIFMGGGLKESASESFIEISRRHNFEEASKLSSQMVKTYTMNIDRNLKLSPKDEAFELMPFDYIYIRSAPSYFTQQTVKIQGEIKFPGSYSIKSKNERISDLIKRAGGFTDFAHIDGATLQRSYNIQNIELTDLNMSKDSLGIDSSIRQMQANLLELNLKKIMDNPGSIYDYKLKKGDLINIPMASSEVRVVGEVLNPIGLAYEKGKSLRYYIQKTGGFTNNAKKSKVYVLYANGTTKITKGFISKDYPPIMPGCQIVIPPKPERLKQDNSGKWMAFASVMSSLAIAFATIFK